MQLRSFIKSSLPKLGLAFGSIVFTLFLAEIGFRFLTGEKVRLQGMWAPHEVMGLMLAPGFEGSMKSSEFNYDVVINEHGMRDEPLDENLLAQEDPGVRRVILTGDSFVFGNGVNLENSLPKVLERQLNAEVEGEGVTYKTYNAGMPGTGTFHHLHNLRRLAPLIRPDLVVHFFFVGDDWYGNRPQIPPAKAKRSFNGWLRASSSLYRYLDRFLLSRSKSVNRYMIHYEEAPQVHLARVDRIIELIDQIGETATEYGADLRICIIPRYVQVYEEAWKKAAFVYGLEDGVYNILEPNRLLARRLDERGFRTFDLLQPLRDEGKKRSLHFPIDGHWNVEGNIFVAEVVAATLQTEELAPPVAIQDGLEGVQEEAVNDESKAEG